MLLEVEERKVQKYLFNMQYISGHTLSHHIYAHMHSEMQIK